jgi:hypothetical protein
MFSLLLSLATILLSQQPLKTDCHTDTECINACVAAGQGNEAECQDKLSIAWIVEAGESPCDYSPELCTMATCETDQQCWDACMRETNDRQFCIEMESPTETDDCDTY